MTIGTDAEIDRLLEVLEAVELSAGGRFRYNRSIRRQPARSGSAERPTSGDS